MSDLKPCPFCGSKAELYESEPSSARYNEGAVHFAVNCLAFECGVMPKSNLWHISESDAIKAWNTRPLEKAKDARIAELEEMLKRFIPSNDYPELDEDGEDVCCNYGGEFQYDDGSEYIGLKVIELLAKGGE